MLSSMWFRSFSVGKLSEPISVKLSGLWNSTLTAALLVAAMKRIESVAMSAVFVFIVFYFECSWLRFLN